LYNLRIRWVKYDDFLVATHFALRWTKKLPAHKPGGLYKTYRELHGVLL
jgi:hypothetical protein